MTFGTAAMDPAKPYALVSYVPGKLGEFLDELRQELQPGCASRSHVTVLPPRAMAVSADVEQTERILRDRIAPFAPFHLIIDGIDRFKETSVIIAEIGAGKDRLIEMHAALNFDGLAQEEVYAYHPHITLAFG